MISIKTLRKCAALFCCVSLLMPAGIGAAAREENKTVLYVAPYGNDSADGSIDAPLATLDGARKRVRSVSKKQPVEIIFRGGDYRFDDIVYFTGEDSGEAANPIVYKAMEGETPVFKASAELKNPAISKVTDERVLRRIQKSARHHVVQINLNGQIEQKDIRLNVDMEPTLDCFKGGEPNVLYIDNVKQTLSEWPNGDGNYTHWLTSENGRTITYEGTNPIYWGEAKDWWIGGYQDWDWRYSRISGKSVDPVNKTITVTNQNSNFQFTSYQSRRWKAFNLLEEIDMPGEYYIDRDTMTLYLYPPYSLGDAKLELSKAGGGFLNILSASNITFQGITFTQCCDDAVVMRDVKNIDFIDCTFKELAARGIYVSGSQKAQTDAEYWQRQVIDASYDCDINGCVFYNIGSSAINMSGGNVDTLTLSGNVIENNIFYMCSMTVKAANAVQLEGCGSKFLHNNMSRCAYQGVLYRGNDMEIMYNEMYDCIQETDDCGIIYSGRNTLMQGNVIAYNYLHDSGSTEELTFGHQCAIYWDDRLCGQTAYKNIIKNVNKNIYTNGIDNVYKDNTSVDILLGSMDIKNGGAARNSTDETSPGFGSVIANPEIYYARYKNLKTVLKMMEKDSTNPLLASFNVVTGNLDVNAKANIIGSNTVEYGVYRNNVQLDECSDFADSENQDYRIKSGSATAKKMPDLLDDSFDIEQIGVSDDVELNSETAPFKQLYPQNGATAVGINELEFKWENAFGASRYRLVIATDREMSDIVYDGIAASNVQKVEGLSKNTVYFWRVYAVNRSREFNSVWESISPVFTFRTAVYEELNTDYFNNVVNVTKQKAEAITEGEAAGEYKIGTKNTLYDIIDRANVISKLRLGSVSQKKFDAVADRIGNYFRESGLVNKGAVDLGNYIENPNLWSGEHFADNGEIILRGQSEKANVYGMTGLTGIDYMSGLVIYCFDAKFKIDSGFIDIGINKNIAGPQWVATNNGYSLVIKPDCIELQRATGTAHSLLQTVEYEVGTDWHSIEYGYINIGVGDIVILNIDGEPVIEYRDVDEPVNTPGNLCMLVYNTTQNSVTIRRSSAVMTEDRFNAQLKRNIYRTAKTLLDSIRSDYNEREPFVFIKNGASKIINEQGVVDVSDSPVNEFMIPVRKISDILGEGTEVTESGGGYCVVWKDAKVQLTTEDCPVINGIAVTSVQNLLDKLKRGYVKEDSKGLIIVGNIVTMNNSKTINNISSLIDYIQTLGDREDVKYYEGE